jgi:hypothetical protein
MTESPVGISGLCQLATLLSYLDSDDALLLREDIARSVALNFAQICVFKRLWNSCKNVAEINQHNVNNFIPKYRIFTMKS